MHALADGGPPAVAVERLAVRLQTTKGSFYWHFKDRKELITEALATWERKATDALIEEMQQIADPVERLHRLVIAATELEEEEHPDVRLLPSASDPVVGEVVKRVQRKRLDFLARAFRDAGFPPAESRLRARLAYSLYLGWFGRLPALEQVLGQRLHLLVAQAALVGGHHARLEALGHHGVRVEQRLAHVVLG